MKRSAGIGLLALFLLLTTPQARAWWIVAPQSGQTYAPGDTVAGMGFTMWPTPGTFAFIQRTQGPDGDIVPNVELSVGVVTCPVPTMIGMPMDAWVGILPAPDGGWTVSPNVPGFPMMFVPDHDTAVQDAVLPLFPFVTGSMTGPHYVKP